jgi:ZIP family zinc transporter
MDVMSWYEAFPFLFDSVLAGILASFACGLGVFPLLIRSINLKKHIGVGYSFAGGLMFSASVYNLLLPALTIGRDQAVQLIPIIQILGGIMLGCWFLWFVESHLTKERLESAFFKSMGGKTTVLVFIAMFFHSIPEGVAVGVGFSSGAHHEHLREMGIFIAIAIAIHNIPEGLAVALPMRSDGASINKCFWMAVLTSLPQPIASIPASLAVWFFEPLMLPMFGFAAGAMMYLVIQELIPDSLETVTPTVLSWSFMAGFSLMLVVQFGL